MSIDGLEVYDTQDFGQAIALSCKGFELLNMLHGESGNRVTFQFRRTPELVIASQAYWSGSLSIDAKTFWNESKNLKARLYSQN